MKDHIFCVRIAQRVLPEEAACGYKHFPFERVYLAQHRLAPQFRKLFRYYLSLTLDESLLGALNTLAVTKEREIRHQRDDGKLQGATRKNPRDAFNGVIQNPADWLMVVPTHVRTKYKDEKEHKYPESSELGYLLSRTIIAGFNETVRMPQIALHTPKRTIPILCGVCKHNLDLHAGKCLPGRPSCADKIKVVLRLDKHNSDTTAQSVNETGGSE